MTDDMDHFPEMTPEDAAVANGQTSVVHSAFQFLTAFYAIGSLEEAWSHVDETLQLCWAQWWGCANEATLREHGVDPVAAAERLAQTGPCYELWEGFERAILRDFRATFPLDVSTCGIGMAPRPMALDVELLLAHRNVPSDGMWPEGASSSVVVVVMKFDGTDWKVANLGYGSLPSPGWPPSLEGDSFPET